VPRLPGDAGGGVSGAEAQLDFLIALGREIATQDGMGTPEGPTHVTGWPIYQVEQEVKVYNIDTSRVDADGTDIDGVPFVVRHELVQGAVSLTRTGIEEYLRLNGHNLRNPRIFIGSMNRVVAMQKLVNALKSLVGLEGKVPAILRLCDRPAAEGGAESPPTTLRDLLSAIPFGAVDLDEPVETYLRRIAQPAEGEGAKGDER
jgi:hypothetical protein